MSTNDKKLAYLVGYMEAALTSMRDLILEEQYSKLFPKIDDALKLLKEKYPSKDFFDADLVEDGG